MVKYRYNHHVSNFWEGSHINEGTNTRCFDRGVCVGDDYVTQQTLLGGRGRVGVVTEDKLNNLVPTFTRTIGGMLVMYRATPNLPNMKLRLSLSNYHASGTWSPQTT